MVIPYRPRMQAHPWINTMATSKSIHSLLCWQIRIVWIEMPKTSTAWDSTSMTKINLLSISQLRMAILSSFPRVPRWKETWAWTILRLMAWQRTTVRIRIKWIASTYPSTKYSIIMDRKVSLHHLMPPTTSKWRRLIAWWMLHKRKQSMGVSTGEAKWIQMTEGIQWISSTKLRSKTK